MKNNFIKNKTIVQKKPTKTKSNVPKWQLWLLLAFMALWTIGSVLGGVAFVKADVPQFYSISTDKPFDNIPNTTDLYGYSNFSYNENNSNKVILFTNDLFNDFTTIAIYFEIETSTIGGNLGLTSIDLRNYLTGSNYSNSFYINITLKYEGDFYNFKIYDYLIQRETSEGTYLYMPIGQINCSIGSATKTITISSANPFTSSSRDIETYTKTFDYDLSYSNAYKQGYELGYNDGYNNGSEFVYNSLLDGLFTNASTQYGLSCYSSYYESIYGDGSWNIPFTLDISSKGDIINFSNLYNAIVQNNNISLTDTSAVDFGTLVIDLSYPLYFGGITLKSTIYNTSSIFRLYSSITDTYYNCTFSIEDGSIIPLDNLSNIIIDKIIIDYTGDPKFTFFDGSYLQVVGQNNTPFYEAFNSGYYRGLQQKSQEQYELGYKAGEKSGLAQGYQNGLNATEEYNFLYLITSVVDAPVQVVKKFLDFNILGFNMAQFFFSIMTLCIVLVVVRLVLMKM